MGKPITFFDVDGKRRTLRMSGFTDEQRDKIKQHVLALNSARLANVSLDQSTAIWLRGVSLDFLQRLADVSLIPSPEVTTIKEYLAARIAAYTARSKAGKLSPDTLRTKQNAADCMYDFFVVSKKIKRIQDITEADASDFRDWLLQQGGRPVKKCGPEIVVKQRKGLAEATTRLRCRHAGEFLNYALQKRLITANPFNGVPTGSVATENERIVSEGEARRIWDELPNLEWRILFGLARWAGLRVGSEPRKLELIDINWERREFLVHCVKTRHHGAKHATRLVPFFHHAPWLWQALEERDLQAAEGETLLLPMLTGRTDAALRSTLHRAIDRAGVQRWDDLWRTRDITESCG